MTAAARTRVVMVHDYPPLTGGGLALSVRDLAALLAERFEVRVCSARMADHFADDRGLVGAVAARPTLGSLFGSDCVVVHWTFSFRWLSTLMLLVAPRSGRPTVCVLHTAPEHCDYNRIRRLPPLARTAAMRTLSRMLSRCDEVVALSPSHARAVLAAGVPVTAVLPLPVGLTAPPTGVSTRRDLADRVPIGRPVVLGVVGELSELKGSDDLPALIRALLPRHRLAVVGRGPYTAALHAVADALPRPMREALTLRDLLPPEDMPAFYRTIDAVLLCSRTESQSRVALECMLAGVVVLARPTTGLSDLVVEGRTGFVIDPGDPASVHDCLERLIAHPDLVAGVRRRARRHAVGLLRDVEAGWPPLIERAMSQSLRDRA